MKTWIKGGLIGVTMGVITSLFFIGYIIFHNLINQNYELLKNNIVYEFVFLFVFLLVGFSIGAIIGFIKENKEKENKEKKMGRRVIWSYGIKGLIVMTMLNLFLFILNLWAIFFVDGRFALLIMLTIFLFIPLAIIGLVIGIIIGFIKIKIEK